MKRIRSERRYKPLRDGHIHVRCYKCGLKKSNIKRESYDPPHARVAEIICPNCSVGEKGEGETNYYDKRGKWIDYDPVTPPAQE